jgi:N-sulfoglucosamine sulfohydrolase
MKKCWLVWVCILSVGALAAAGNEPARPNIFFFFADDWGRDAGAYSDPKAPSPSDIVKTPNIDRLAREGVRFNNAFYDCPQCRPSRAAIVTGNYFWRCGSDAILSGSDWTGLKNPFDAMPRFPELLAGNGYATGKAFKTLDFTDTLKIKSEDKFRRYGLYVSPAKTPEKRGQRRQEVIAQTREIIQKLLAKCPKDKPFFFVYGPINTHRPYAAGSGRELWGINPDTLRGKLPPCLPDVPEVRTDYADYLGEVQALDMMVGIFVEELEKAGQADNTLLVLAGDNGVPGFTRGKTQLYDLGCHAPLIVRWPGRVKPGRTVDDFVTLKDLAATFLEAGGVKPPATMDARSLMPQLLAEKSGTIDPGRDAAIFGRERHVPTAREGNLPYPARALYTPEFAYIRNFKPDRFPFGDPTEVDGKVGLGSFADMDGSLTKTWLIAHSRDEQGKPFFDLAFGKRPAEELYNMRTDPQQMHNLAGSPEYQTVLKQYSERLQKVLQETRDPRLDDAFDRAPYIAVPEKKAGGKDLPE